MLPWIRVPNTKSSSRRWSNHGHGSTNIRVRSSRSSAVRTWAGRTCLGVVLEAVAPQQQPERVDVLGEVFEVRVALDVGA